MKGESLTAREQDILKLLCEGYSDREIAERLVLSLGTVKWYNKQIFSKLGVNNRVQATIAARVREPAASMSSLRTDLHLPRFLTPFIGRSEVIDQVCRLLRENRLMMIVGPGGTGKTRLSVEVARQFHADNHFETYYESLATYTTPETVPLAIASSLDLTIRDQDAALEQVIAALSRQPTLLILDNFEHLIDAAATLETLTRSVTTVRLLVTSRERLNLYGEMVYPLDGLPVTSNEKATPARDSEAVALFLNRAQLADASFSPSADELDDVTSICTLLHGIPLAIEQAASWMHILDTAAILAEIQRGLAILRTNLQGIESRHQSMRAVLDSAWERLTAQERGAFTWLSVFRGGFEREAAAEVADADFDILASLVAKSFIARVSAERYDMHEIHRQYAVEKLVERGELHAANQSHAAYFTALVERICPQRWGNPYYQPSALDRLDADFANLRAAVLWSLHSGDGCLALQIVSKGAYFFADRGHAPEAAPRVRPALKQCSDMDPHLRARAYHALRECSSAAERQLHLQWANRSENDWLIAEAHFVAGWIAFEIDNAPDDAQHHLDQSLRLFRQREDETMVAVVLNSLGELAEQQGDLERAAEYIRRAFQMSRKEGLNDPVRPMNLGRVLVKLGDEAQARSLFQAALDRVVIQGSPIWAYYVLYEVARYLCGKRAHYYAAQVLATCRMLCMQIAFPPEPVDTLLVSLRSQMGDDATLDQLWAAGKTLSMAEAISLAQQALDELSE